MIEYEDDEDDDWGTTGADCVGPDGLRVFASPCSTCIFRPGNPMTLQPGRVRGMVEAVVQNDGFTPCHQTLTGEHPPTLCHGMTQRHPGELYRLFERMGAISLIEPPIKENR